MNRLNGNEKGLARLGAKKKKKKKNPFFPENFSSFLFFLFFFPGSVHELALCLFYLFAKKVFLFLFGHKDSLLVCID